MQFLFDKCCDWTNYLIAKPPVVGPAAVKKATEDKGKEAAKKDEPEGEAAATPAPEAEAKADTKSRSRSRKRASLFGVFGKKDEAEDKKQKAKEEKKPEEESAAPTESTAAAGASTECKFLPLPHYLNIC